MLFRPFFLPFLTPAPCRSELGSGRRSDEKPETAALIQEARVFVNVLRERARSYNYLYRNAQLRFIYKTNKPLRNFPALPEKAPSSRNFPKHARAVCNFVPYKNQRFIYETLSLQLFISKQLISKDIY